MSRSPADALTDATTNRRNIREPVTGWKFAPEVPKLVKRCIETTRRVSCFIYPFLASNWLSLAHACTIRVVNDRETYKTCACLGIVTIWMIFRLKIVCEFVQDTRGGIKLYNSSTSTFHTHSVCSTFLMIRPRDQKPRSRAETKLWRLIRASPSTYFRGTRTLPQFSAARQYTYP